MVFRMLVIGLLGAIVIQLAWLERWLGVTRECPVDARPAVVHVSKDALEKYGELELAIPHVRLVLEP